MNGFYVIMANVFSINQNVIEIYNIKNIKFFYQNFVDVALKANVDIWKTKIHDLVFEIAVPYLENCFLLVTFPNSHLIIYVC